MGIYLNPGTAGFEESVRSQIYVDKTGLIAYTNTVLFTRQKYVCVSRPRRFGKSMAAEMLAAYYGRGVDADKMFVPFEIATVPSFSEHLNKYDVIQVSVQDFLTWHPDMSEMVKELQAAVIKELDELYPSQNGEGDLTKRLLSIHKQTGTRFVFIIDEWDCVFRVHRYDTEAQKAYLDFLRNLLKDKPYIALAYMTGILPIKKYGSHSALNMFDEFSMTDQMQLERFTGFTQEEVDALCERFGVDSEEIRSWYNGYSFRKVDAVYNPLSVVKAVSSGVLKSYWTQTETYEALREFIVMDYDGLRDKVALLLAGEHLPVDIGNFSNDMTTFESADDVLTLLIHLGYLGYDAERGEVFIPNREISAEFVNAMKHRQWPEVIAAVQASKKLLEAAWALDGEAVAKGIAAAHFETAILNSNDEDALAYTLSLALYAARDRYTIIRELPTGKGFADMAFIPRPNQADIPALLVELKWDKDASTAIDQIHARDYPAALAAYAGNLLLVGVSYDKDTKEHNCTIERA
jgi:hypothetical protein